jgi:hypothetical protein
MVNVTGWNELMNGSITTAAYTVYNSTLEGYLLLVLFVALSLFLYMRTDNAELVFTVGIIFFVTFVVTGWMSPLQYGIVILILVFELAGILYKVFFK